MKKLIPNDFTRCVNFECKLPCKRIEQTKIDEKEGGYFSYIKFIPIDGKCEHQIKPDSV